MKCGKAGGVTFESHKNASVFVDLFICFSNIDIIHIQYILIYFYKIHVYHI